MINLFRRRRSVELNPCDPTYKTVYLGNILTIVARPSDDAEMVKPLAKLWSSYLGRKKQIQMQLTVANCGLKARTNEHGQVDYWAHRVTFCTVQRDHPRLFVWIYRHEGKNMKPELRMHAVLCSKAEKAQRVATQLQERLARALQEFKREKQHQQQSRLRHENLMSKCAELSEILSFSSADSADTSSSSSTARHPGHPRRKQIKSCSKHFRPPTVETRGGRLDSIEESQHEEQEQQPTVESESDDDDDSTTHDDLSDGASTELSRDSAVVFCSSTSSTGTSESVDDDDDDDDYAASTPRNLSQSHIDSTNNATALAADDLSLESLTLVDSSGCGGAYESDVICSSPIPIAFLPDDLTVENSSPVESTTTTNLQQHVT